MSNNRSDGCFFFFYFIFRNRFLFCSAKDNTNSVFNEMLSQNYKIKKKRKEFYTQNVQESQKIVVDNTPYTVLL